MFGFVCFLVLVCCFLGFFFVWGPLFACGVLVCLGFFISLVWFGFFLMLQLLSASSAFFLNVQFRLNHDFNSPVNFSTLVDFGSQNH